MALSNLDTTKLYVDIDDLSPRSNTGDDTSVDQVAEVTGVYTTSAGAGGGEIVVDGNNKTIYFQALAGNNFEFAGSGITGQALYSFLKYLWKNTASITKFDFPMLSITNEQFEFINGWSLDDAQTLTQIVRETAISTITTQNVITTTDGTVDFRKFQAGDVITITNAQNAGITGTVVSSTKTTITCSGTPFTNGTDVSTQIDVDFIATSSELIRTAGWTVQDSISSYVKEIYAGTITLGTLVDQTDQPYYIQQSALDAPTTNLNYTGPANEAVAIRSIANASVTGNNLSDIGFSGTNTITSTTTDLSVFKLGDIITVTGTSLNNGTFTVSPTILPTATVLTIVEAGTAEASQPAVIDADRRATFQIFVRERGKTYADANLQDIGVTGNMTYIVYRYPVSNAVDLNIVTTVDTEISAGEIVPATVNPFDDIQIEYLVGINGEYNILGPVGAGTYAVDDVLKDDLGRWYAVTGAGTLDATDFTNLDTLPGAGTATTIAFEGERYVLSAYYAFTVIIDANDLHTNIGGTTPYVDANNNTTVEDVYEFAQWALRRTTKLNEGVTGVGERNGNIADLLVDFVGPTLITRPGVFIDSIATNDQNSVQFTEASSTIYTGASNLAYPRVVSVRINFNTNLSEDADSVFYAYYTTTPNGNNFGQENALQVLDSALDPVGTSVTNNIPSEADVGAGAGEGSFYSFSYDYDGDNTGGRVTDPAADVPITIVGVGLSTGQYVLASGLITSAGGTVTLVAPLERNYSDPV